MRNDFEKIFKDFGKEMHVCEKSLEMVSVVLKGPINRSF